MIPPKIIRFLEERANAGFAGTRNADLMPHGHRVPGWQIDAAGRVLTAFIPEASVERLLDDVRDHGPIAITLEEVGTHETYQIKGRCMTHRPVCPADIEIANRARDRFARGLRVLYGDAQIEAAIKASIPTPALAVEIEVQEVFVQTPGPGAGARIAPPPDAERSAT